MENPLIGRLKKNFSRMVHYLYIGIVPGILYRKAYIDFMKFISIIKHLPALKCNLTRMFL